MTQVAMGTQEGRLRRPRWMLALLVASLALNLIVIGSVAGAMWRFRAGGLWAANGVTPNLLGYASTLPAERRKALWDRTAEDRQHVRPFRRELRAAREEVVRVLAVEPFDREKFMAAQSQLLDAENRARTAVHQLYGEVAAGMTAEERRGFQRWREHRRAPNRNLLDEPDQSAKGGAAEPH